MFQSGLNAWQQYLSVHGRERRDLRKSLRVVINWPFMPVMNSKKADAVKI
jgi:hypothetical protein